MAKKSRRARRQSRQRRPSPAAAPSQPAAEALKSQPTPGGDQASVASPARRAQVDFSREYHYVINDLRNMAVIAVAMLAVLIALSFVIR
jgi:hypothetical protein